MSRTARLGRWPARGVAIGLVVLGVVLAIHLAPNKIITAPHPGLVDQIFNSRILVLFIRVVIVFAAGFIVASLFANVWASRWLAKAGPFEVSESVVADLKDQVRASKEEAATAADEIAALQVRLDKSDLTIHEMAEVIAALETEQHPDES